MSDLEGRLRASDDLGPVPDPAPAAQRAGLIDVAYECEDTPCGPLLLAATEAGLVRVAFLATASAEGVLATLASRISPRILRAPARLDAPRRALEAYFAGRARSFGVPLDRRLMTPFGRRVLEATDAIPYGETRGYSAIATAVGAPRAARAAGGALAANPLPIVIPCHRVLPAGGGIGGYVGGPERKAALLALERAER